MTTSVAVPARPLALTEHELEQLFATNAPEKRLLEALELVTLREEKPAPARRSRRLSRVLKCVAIAGVAALLAYGATR